MQHEGDGVTSHGTDRSYDHMQVFTAFITVVHAGGSYRSGWANVLLRVADAGGLNGVDVSERYC